MPFIHNREVAMRIFILNCKSVSWMAGRPFCISIRHARSVLARRRICLACLVTRRSLNWTKCSSRHQRARRYSAKESAKSPRHRRQNQCVVHRDCPSTYVDHYYISLHQAIIMVLQDCLNFHKFVKIIWPICTIINAYMYSCRWHDWCATRATVIKTTCFAVPWQISSFLCGGKTV